MIDKSIKKSILLILLIMSHFTYIKTRFQNLFYLEKALNRLNIVHKDKEKKDPINH